MNDSEISANERTVPRIVHVGFYCRDMKRSVAWYEQVLGMNTQFRVRDHACGLRFNGCDKEDHDIFLAQAPAHFEKLTPMVFDFETLTATAGRVGFYHVAIDFQSFDEAMEAYGRALALDTELGKAAQHHDGRGIYVRDPDGNLVELFSFIGCVDEEYAKRFTVPYPGSEGRAGGFAMNVAATYAKWLAHRKQQATVS